MAKGEGSGKGVVGCLICVSLIFGIGLSIVAFVGMIVAIWQCADIISTNDELMSLARNAVPDDRLRDSYYVFIAFTLIAQVLSCVGGRNKQSGEDDEGSKQSSCAGTFFSLALIAGHMASGIMGALYKDETIPEMLEGMRGLLNNETYFSVTPAGDNPKYTKIGEYWNFLQTKFECCGVDLSNARNYIDADFLGRYGVPFPYSCCVLREKKKADWRNITKDDVENWEECQKFEPNYFHTDTCHKIEKDWLEGKANFIIGYNFCLLALSLGSFALLLVIVICAMCCS